MTHPIRKKYYIKANKYVAPSNGNYSKSYIEMVENMVFMYDNKKALGLTNCRSN